MRSLQTRRTGRLSWVSTVGQHSNYYFLILHTFDISVCKSVDFIEIFTVYPSGGTHLMTPEEFLEIVKELGGSGDDEE